MKLVVAICSARDWKPQFGMSLAGLIAHVCTRKIKGVQVDDFDLRVYANVSNINNGRQRAIDEAIARKFTHVLFLDDDMTFPADILDYLAEHKADIVGVNYSHKSKATTGMALGMDGKYLKARDGVAPVLRNGFGVMLVNLDVPKKIKPPHFAMPWSDHHQSVIGEDYFFCDRVIKAGGAMLCDLRVKVGHIGDYEYMLDDPCFADAAKNRPSEKAA